MIACTECGTQQSEDRKSCTRCSFPLPQKRRTSPARSHDHRREVARRPAGGPATALGHGGLDQCYPVLLTASLLLVLHVVLGFAYGSIGYELLPILGLFWLPVAWTLLKGSAGARRTLLLAAVLLGGVSLLLIAGFQGISHYLGLSALPTSGPGFFNATRIHLAYFSGKVALWAAVVILLNGRGSAAKAATVGIAAAVSMLLAFGSVSSSMREFRRYHDRLAQAASEAQASEGPAGRPQGLSAEQMQQIEQALRQHGGSE